MRRIVKAKEPEALSRRRSEILSTPGVTDFYGSLGDSARLSILNQSIKEQAGLCAYTTIRISVTSCHIEHMYPQSDSDPLETIDYANIVLCAPAATAPRLPFRAQAKDAWPSRGDRGLFLLPTDPSVESRLLFEPTGTVRSAGKDDKVAAHTIERLKLNDDQLKGLRLASLEPLKSVSKIDHLRKRLKGIEAAGSSAEEHCVAKKQYLKRRLQRLRIARDAKQRMK